MDIFAGRSRGRVDSKCEKPLPSGDRAVREQKVVKQFAVRWGSRCCCRRLPSAWDNSCLARPSASLVPPTVGAPHLPAALRRVGGQHDRRRLAAHTLRRRRCARRCASRSTRTGRRRRTAARSAGWRRSSRSSSRRSAPSPTCASTSRTSRASATTSTGTRRSCPTCCRARTPATRRPSARPPAAARRGRDGAVLRAEGRRPLAVRRRVGGARRVSAAMQLGRLPWVAANATGAATAAAAHDCAPNAPSWGWQPPAATTTSFTSPTPSARRSGTRSRPASRRRRRSRWSRRWMR